jgi:hypothetical protein
MRLKTYGTFTLPHRIHFHCPTPADNVETFAATVANRAFASRIRTFYLENDGRLEHAQQMAAHESPRTTKLYDRTKDEITIGEVERIQL